MTDLTITDRTPKWRFESFDPRAGLAFAVWRPARTTEAWAPQDFAPCLFFSPPEFVPEPIANIALAMSAARGSFDPGMFIDGREAFFDEPGQVAEFVRRAFVASASGEGGDGGEPGAGPVPRPDLPWEPSPPSELANQFNQTALEAIREFDGASQLLAFGETGIFNWSKKLGAGPGQRGIDATQGLVAGALCLLEEMARRAPMRSRMTGSPAEAMRWQLDARLLGAYIASLDLLPFLFAGPAAVNLLRLLRQFDFLVVGRFESEPEELAWRYQAMFGDGPALDDRDGLHWQRWRFFQPGWPWSATANARGAASLNPIEMLRRVPLPAAVTSMLPGDNDERASAYHLLCAFAANPQSILADSAGCAMALDISIFAAACITARTESLASEFVFQLDFYRSPTPMHQERVRGIAADAARWLMEHLPEQVYCPAFESMLRQAQKIRYSRRATSDSNRPVSAGVVHRPLRARSGAQ